jgi:hypothetical protein
MISKVVETLHRILFGNTKYIFVLKAIPAKKLVEIGIIPFFFHGKKSSEVLNWRRSFLFALIHIFSTFCVWMERLSHRQGQQNFLGG